MTRYWEALRPRCKTPLRTPPRLAARPVRLRRDALELAEALARAAAEVGIDHASYLVGRTYASMLPDDFRAANGVFYTPPSIVERLLDAAEQAGTDWATCWALDPACGGGAFLGPVARRMLQARKGADRRSLLRDLGARLKGYEIDPFSAWLSTVFLDATLHEELGVTGGDRLQPIDVCDSLTRHTEAAEFDLVMGNPPYGRVSLDQDVRSIFKRSLYGHANLYGLFLDLALRRTKPGGVIAYVTPTGFLCGEYFKNLRALLGSEAPPAALDFVSDRSGVFDDVLQETLLAVFKRAAKPAPFRVSFLSTSGEGARSTSAAEEATLPDPVDGPWIMPRSAGAAALAARLRTLSSRLEDWGYGVSTGPLVWNRFKPRLRQSRAENAVPLIWAEAVTPDGRFVYRAARRNHAPYFAIKEGDDALLVRRSCVLLQRTTAKEQARRLIAAELPQSFLDEHGGAVTVENHLNMIVPLVEAPAVEPGTLAAFLNSEAADRAFRCISGTVAVSAYELEAMPLPPAWAMEGLTAILRREGSRVEIEAFCRKLYGER